jgi:tripartite-type tricarboxylate transporter receptor subunit TctC
VVIDNQPGAGGLIGTTQIVRAAPDGRTIGVVSSNHAVNPSLYRHMPFDPVNDVVAITTIGRTPLVVLAYPGTGLTDLKGLIAAAKAKPGALNYGSSGNGTILHLAMAWLASDAGIELQHVPYRGAGQMLQDLIAGQVELGVFAVTVAAGHVRGGQLRALAVTPATRTPVLPDVPTVAEQGLAGYEIEGWFAAVGPKGLPGREIARINAAFRTALATSSVQEKFAEQGNAVTPSTPDEAQALLRDEVKKYARLVQVSGIQPD